MTVRHRGMIRNDDRFLFSLSNGVRRRRLVIRPYLTCKGCARGVQTSFLDLYIPGSADIKTLFLNMILLLKGVKDRRKQSRTPCPLEVCGITHQNHPAHCEACRIRWPFSYLWCHSTDHNSLFFNVIYPITNTGGLVCVISHIIQLSETV